jgi:hypothetical protein
MYNAGNNNTAVGTRALMSFRISIDGLNNNTGVGFEALRNITTGTDNVGIGMQALSANSSGRYNTAVGSRSLYSNITGNSNIAIGNQVLYSSVSASSNIAMGNGALYSDTTGVDNIAIGSQALYNDWGGYYNVAIGKRVLYSTERSRGNTAIGDSALFSSNVRYNTATGYGALRKASGSYNTATGYQALYNNTTGAYNTAVGANALSTNTTGSYNTAIGNGADVKGNNLTNATAIGNGASAMASNSVMVGNSNIGIIGGYVTWSNVSDVRIKKNIQAGVPGLAFINRLQPVTYNLDLDAADKIVYSGNPGNTVTKRSAEETAAREKRQKRVQSGFVAQEVEKAAQSIGYDFSGVDADENGEGLYSLRYSEFVVPLVKAVQELSEQNAAKDPAIAGLQERVAALTGLVNQLLEQKIETNTLRSGNTGNEPAGSGSKNVAVSTASLQQNFPNPFNQAATIRYYLPETFRSAKIVVTDVTGKIAKQIPVSGSGQGSLTIEAASLFAGVYYYSLLVDDRLIDTKKMILTE